MTDVTAPTAPSGPEVPAGNDVIDGSKLMRLEGEVSAILEELHQVDGDAWDEPRVNQLVARILAEVGSCLPDALLDELRRLIGPLRDPAPGPSTVRVVLAQLEGWLSAVVAEAMSAVVVGQVVDPAHIPPAEIGGAGARPSPNGSRPPNRFR